MQKSKLRTKDIVIIAMLSALLFAQEEALTFIPQFQLTVLLLILYSKVLGFFKTSIIITIHVLLDNLVMGSLSLVYTPSMWFGWMVIPTTLCTIFKNVEKASILAILAIAFSLIYSWSFILPTIIITKVDFVAYMIGDIPFEIMLCVYSFLTVFWLYDPLKKVLKMFNDKNSNQRI